MARKILVPIDFRVASLNTLKLALEAEEADEVQVLLLLATQLSNSITKSLTQSLSFARCKPPRKDDPRISGSIVHSLLALRAKIRSLEHQGISREKCIRDGHFLGGEWH